MATNEMNIRTGFDQTQWNSLIEAIKDSGGGGGDIDEKVLKKINDMYDSLSNYGLVDMFDGQFIQGYHQFDNGIKVIDSPYYITNTNYIDVSNKTNVKVATDIIIESFQARVFNANNQQLAFIYQSNVDILNISLPTNASKLYINLYKSQGITINDVAMTVFLNNQIDDTITKLDNLIQTLTNKGILP